MTFAQRFLDFTFVLGEGAFGESGQNTVKLSGLRATTRIENAGGRAMGTLQAQIFGMRLDQMNELCSLGMVSTSKRKNSITVEAGDVGSVPSVVFQGTIQNAWPDLNQSPTGISMIVMAQTGLLDVVKPSLPISISGSGDVATMLASIASQMNISFENNGVNVKLSNPYYGGTPFAQARAIVRDAGIEWNACSEKTLAIWNPGQARGGLVPIVSAETGMIGYPTFNPLGIIVRALFNPSFGLGRKINVVSKFVKIPEAEWTILKLDYSLDAQVPRGKWECEMLATPASVRGPFVP